MWVKVGGEWGRWDSMAGGGLNSAPKVSSCISFYYSRLHHFTQFPTMNNGSQQQRSLQQNRGMAEMILGEKRKAAAAGANVDTFWDVLGCSVRWCPAFNKYTPCWLAINLAKDAKSQMCWHLPPPQAECQTRRTAFRLGLGFSGRRDKRRFRGVSHMLI